MEGDREGGFEEGRDVGRDGFEGVAGVRCKEVIYRRQCVGVVGVVLGVERPDDLGVRADGRRGLAEWVGVVTGVVGVVLAPDHPLSPTDLDFLGIVVGRLAKLDTALLIEAGLGGGVGLTGRGALLLLALGILDWLDEGGDSVWVWVDWLGSTRRGTSWRWPGAESGLGSLDSAAGGLGAAGCRVSVEPRGDEVLEYPLSDLPDHSSPSISRSNLTIPGGSRPHHPCARRPTSSRHRTTPRAPLWHTKSSVSKRRLSCTPSRLQNLRKLEMLSLAKKVPLRALSHVRYGRHGTSSVEVPFSLASRALREMTSASRHT